jgi:catechol 2,3-dioxygenase-like lactoylglutathione lyase family enzyme
MSESAASTSSATKLGGVNPIFRVANLQASIDYYVNALGFTLNWQVPGMFASVYRDKCNIFLCEGDQGHLGGWVWIGAGDITPLCQEFLAKGAKLRHPPTNYEWAYEMQIEDPDGNVLRFGSDPLPNQPYGEWLDMHGVAWVKNPDGSFSKVPRS